MFFEEGLPVIVWNQVSQIESVDEEKKTVTLRTPVVTPGKEYTGRTFPFDECFQKVFQREDNEECLMITNPNTLA